mmetsp:Transcript_119397/g.309770  ORF Transcript_119397/g.309770 Transcript_119397/m.309770 type:complete len:210 (+) Transcript_119397:172-801(+)
MKGSSCSKKRIGRRRHGGGPLRTPTIGGGNTSSCPEMWSTTPTIGTSGPPTLAMTRYRTCRAMQMLQGAQSLGLRKLLRLQRAGTQRMPVGTKLRPGLAKSKAAIIRVRSDGMSSTGIQTTGVRREMHLPPGIGGGSSRRQALGRTGVGRRGRMMAGRDGAMIVPPSTRLLLCRSPSRRRQQLQIHPWGQTGPAMAKKPAQVGSKRSGK